MSSKQFLATLSLILLTLTSYFAAEIILDTIQQPALIYTNGPLPIFNLNPPSVTEIYGPMVRLATEDGQFFCSGTVISDQYILTAAHCLANRGYFPGIHKGLILVSSVALPNGEIKTVEATSAAINNRADYGLIKGNFQLFQKAPIDASPGASKYGPFYLCGFPWGSSNMCYRADTDLTASVGFYAAKGTLYPGMSGGPVIDVTTGRVIAINSAMAPGGVVYLASLVGLFETLNIPMK